MFSFIRIFMIVSMLAVALTAALVGFYFRAQTHEVTQSLAQATVAAVSRGFVAEIAGPHPEYLTPGDADQAAEARAAIGRFIEDQRGARLSGLRIYSPQGMLLYSTGGRPLPSGEFGRETASPATLTRIVSGGDVAEGLGGTHLRAFLPLPAGEGRVWMEMFLNVTPEWNRLLLLQWLPSASILLIFAVLMWVLVITSRKAETIIATQHETNLELAAAAAAAQAENREKSLFLANISHELRTPLNAIIGFSEIMKTDGGAEITNAKYRDYVNDIHTSGVHLLGLINDILDLSKAEAGKLDMEIEEVNAGKLAVNCLRLVSTRAVAGGVDLVNAVPKEGLVLETDGRKLKQVILNLLSNAVKFTPQGGRVRLAAWRDAGEDTVVFEITDTGIGIAPKDIAKAMSAFGQVDSALSRRYEGTGLGLPLARKFVELMGGRFAIRSEQSEGTVITVSLPRLYRAEPETLAKAG